MTKNRSLTHLATERVMFDKEVIRNLKHIKSLINDMQTKFDHVRGNVESKEIMIATLNRAIEILRSK